MPIALDPNDKEVFIFPEDKDLENPPKFFIRVPTGRDFKTIVKEFGHMADVFSKSKKLSTEEGEEAFAIKDLPIDDMYKLLSMFITGWEDFVTASGKHVAFITDEDGYPSFSNWDRFRLGDILTLFNGIMEVMNIDSVTEKNLKSGQ